MKPSLSARPVSEFLGTGFLVAAVVGSGIMAERLAGGNVALALLANTIATGAALLALILTFGPISGAHLNPVVSFVDAMEGVARQGPRCATPLRFITALDRARFAGLSQRSRCAQEGIDDQDAVQLLTRLQIFRKQVVALERLRRGDDHRVPKRELETVLHFPSQLE